MKEILMYQCDICGTLFSMEDECLKHEEYEKRIIKANQMFIEQNKTLKEINEECKIWYDKDDFEKLAIPSYLENVNKDNCFKISFLQCCNKPAYQIQRILNNGQLQLGGFGSWSGFYTSDFNIFDNSLKDPRPAEELFIHGK